MLNMPDYYVQVDSMPEDPTNAIPRCAQSNTAGIFTIEYPIDDAQTMPFGDVQAVIDGIHSALAEEQGLIEVGSGETKAGKSYIYSIVKSLKDPSGVQYILTYHLKEDGYAVNLQGFFDEIGVTGERDAVVYALLQNQGIMKDGLEGWAMDPYDSEYSKGLLMNISERSDFEEMFPEHPLSMARALVTFLGENN